MPNCFFVLLSLMQQLDKLKVDKPVQAPKECSVIGHRGCLHEEVENTLEGFERCIAMGCDAVELDVFLLKDGTLVVFHGGGKHDDDPGDLSDYCLNQKGRGILDCDTYDEVMKLQFNPDCKELVCPRDRLTDKNLKIPTLEEVLALVKGTGMKITIELKGPGVTRPVLELVQRMDMTDQCTYSSFYHDRIQLVRELHPEYKTGALFNAPVPSDFIQQAMNVGASEVHLRFDMCSVERVRQIHAAGMDSMAWTAGPEFMSQIDFKDVGKDDDDRLYAALLETGVRKICCNRPDLLIKQLKQE